MVRHKLENVLFWHLSRNAKDITYHLDDKRDEMLARGVAERLALLRRVILCCTFATSSTVMVSPSVTFTTRPWSISAV